MLEGILTDPKQPFPVRQSAVRAMARTNKGAHALLAVAKKNKPSARPFLHGRQRVAFEPRQGHPRRCRRLVPRPAGKDNKPLPPVAELLKMHADATPGKAVFAATCVRCHQVNGEGVDFGPNLSEVGTKFGKDAIVTKILQPTSSLAFGYEGKTIKLKSGDQADGLITSQTDDEVTLKTTNATSAILTKYKRSDIADIKTMKVTMMPKAFRPE